MNISFAKLGNEQWPTSNSLQPISMYFVICFLIKNIINQSHQGGQELSWSRIMTVQTLVDYLKAQDLLSRGNVPHHTYKTVEEKTTNMVLRGVTNSQGIEEDEELVGRRLKVISVARTENLQTSRPVPLLSVEMECADNTKNIRHP